MSIRDILTWVYFINTLTCGRSDTEVLDSAMDIADVGVEMDTNATSKGRKLSLASSYIHGACMVFLDGLGAGE